ncbi:MAG TPA: potassium channel protein [Dehalococcoidia bacterium]|nr:potassium channel protein [Dehalococcoidia bacterium]
MAKLDDRQLFMSPRARLLFGIYGLTGIILVGVAGFMIIEGWSFLDALYMTVTTITTVGYSEVHPLSTGGRIFCVFLIVGGVGGALYALMGVVGYIVQGYFGTTLGRRRMKDRIAKLNGHFILCGYGKVGEEIAHVFTEEETPFVVVDKRSDSVDWVERAGYLYIMGDATSDDVLKEAGIERARGLVAAVDSDAENTYITLSARQLNKDLFIAARANSREVETKLKRAGADRIVSPHRIGGRRMAMLALRPAVVDFIDTVTYGRGREMELENVDIGGNSPLAGMTLKTARSKTGITVLAMRKKSGKLLANPSDEETIEDGDRLIVIGTKKRLGVLEEAFEGVKLSD